MHHQTRFDTIRAVTVTVKKHLKHSGRNIEPRTTAIALPALFISIFIAATGCETVTQDFNDFTKSLTPKTPRQAAIEMFDQYDPDNRREGTLLISNSTFGGTDIYITAYRDMVENERDPLALAVAVRALAKHGEPDDALLIVPLLEHENLQVRWEAAKGLQRLHNPAVVPALLTTLGKTDIPGRDDEEPAVRQAAAIALGQYPEDRVFQGLVAALDARELSVNLAAQHSLETLTGTSQGLDRIDWLTWYQSLDHPSEVFAQQEEYLFPTYVRNRAWWEYIAFWTPAPVRETSAPPAGLAREDSHSTYGDDAATQQ